MGSDRSREAAGATRAVAGTRPPGAGPRAFLLVAVLAGIAAIAQLPWLHASSPFGWDEAEHAWHGYEIATDLRRLDVPGFWNDTSRQAFWPPGQSWYLAPFLWVAGPSTVVARAAGLPLVCAALLLVAWLAGILASGGRSVAAIAATVLALGSRNLLLYGRTAYAEPLLLVLVLATTGLWIRGTLRGRRRDFLWAGATAAATFLVKYPYGALLLLVVPLASVALAFADRRAARRSLWFLVPAIGLDTIWLLLPAPDGIPSHLEQFRAFFDHNLSVEDFHPATYYLDSLQKSYAASLPQATFAAIASLALVIGAVRRLLRIRSRTRPTATGLEKERGHGPGREGAVAACVLLVALELIAFLATASAAGAKQERVLLPWAAALWILGGAACGGIACALRRRATVSWRTDGPGFLVTVIVGGLALLGYGFPLRMGGTIPGPEGWEPRRVSTATPWENLRWLYGFRDAPSACYAEARPLLDLVARVLPRDGFTLWLGGFDEFSPFLLRWETLGRIPSGAERDAFVRRDTITVIEKDRFPSVSAISPESEEERIFFAQTTAFDAVITLDPPDPKGRSLRAHLGKYREAFARHPGFVASESATAVLHVREGLDVPTTVTIHRPRDP